MIKTPCGFSTNHSTGQVFMTGTPTPPLIRIMGLAERFMILTGMNNGISSVYGAFLAEDKGKWNAATAKTISN
jgi:hypothetical protein